MFYKNLSIGGTLMTTKEKLIFCQEHGISISYIAKKVNLVPASLTRWIRGEKGILEKNEKVIETTLQELAQEIWEGIGENNDRNL